VSLKLLIFEYITGGGFVQDEIPESLANEGLLMLQALIDELTPLSSIQVTVLLDWRFNQLKLPENIKSVFISNGQSVFDVLPELIQDSDLVWPIAPEMDYILQKITALVEIEDKQLLNSSLKAVSICSDKLLTYQILKEQSIAVVDSVGLDIFLPTVYGSWVIKPKDGAGCLNSFFISSKHEFSKIKEQIPQTSNYIIQPYIEGDSLSLSCIFKNGKAWLLCCNRQQVSIKQGRFELNACEVNIAIDKNELYQQLIGQVASAIPALWGYVGIDLIQPASGDPLILEINPRLTTSYVGINQALGINVAKVVLEMIDNDPLFKKTLNKQHTVLLNT
jgi:predicted ATP-grasp superfamily ATP-dependent carboligase